MGDRKGRGIEALGQGTRGVSPQLAPVPEGCLPSQLLYQRGVSRSWAGNEPT